MISPQVQNEIKELDAKLHSKLGKGISDPNTSQYMQDIYEHDATPYDQIPTDNDIPYNEKAVQQEADIHPDEEAYDKYITAKVLLPRGDTFDRATVMQRKRDHDGNLIGKSHSNPILDSSKLVRAHTSGYCTGRGTGHVLIP
jgi:hypothetical protein